MAQRPILMLTAMAGADFAHAPGDVVPVDAHVYDSWLAAGIGAAPPDAAVAEAARAGAEARAAALEAQLAEMTAERDELRRQAETLGEQVAALEAVQKPAKGK